MINDKILFFSTPKNGGNTVYRLFESKKMISEQETESEEEIERKEQA